WGRGAGATLGVLCPPTGALLFPVGSSCPRVHVNSALQCGRARVAIGIGVPLEQTPRGPADQDRLRFAVLHATNTGRRKPSWYCRVWIALAGRVEAPADVSAIVPEPPKGDPARRGDVKPDVARRKVQG